MNGNKFEIDVEPKTNQFIYLKNIQDQKYSYNLNLIAEKIEEIKEELKKLSV